MSRFDDCLSSYQCPCTHRALHSFPTRRSSDLLTGARRGEIAHLQWSYVNGDTITLPPAIVKNNREHTFPIGAMAREILDGLDRKSTRLNSSHRCISYAVFCLKKKTKTNGH